ncbi:MAG: type II secretion system protein [Lentisphaeria bacterium]|nr:type II secretion system protein [Lentisphaeria bacterium]
MNKTSRKFTLIELLITMTIGIILIGLVGQNLMKKPAGIRRKEALNQVKVCFSNAKMLALATSSKTEIRLSPDGKNIEVIQVNMSVNPFSKSTRTLEAEENETVIKKRRIIAKPIRFALPNGCTIKPKDEDLISETEQITTMFTFYPEGGAYGDIFKLSTGTRNFNIEADQLTGQLIISENNDL